MSDEKARKMIIQEIDSNMFVEAGAGSGKTTMLVERMTAMVEKGLPVEKICTITFTKAAANEFYERFQRRLIERSVIPDSYEEADYRLSKPNKITVERCKEALKDIDLCFMGTIDSFCNMILSEHPIEAGIPFDGRLIEEKEELDLYRQFYIKVLNGEYGNALRNKARDFSMLFYNGEESFGKLMKQIMDHRNARFDFAKQSDLDPYNFLKQDRETMIRILDRLEEDPSGITLQLSKTDERDPQEVYRNASNILHKGWHYNFSGVQRSLKDIANLSYDKSPDELGFTNEGFIREKASKTVLNIADEDSKDALIPKLREYKYYKSMSLLLDCVSLLETQMRKQGRFTFFDYLYYLRNMLQKDAIENKGKLIEYIYGRHSYFLIDEFQDTNPLQAEVFFHLCSLDPSISDWKKCQPRPGSLFIVGDPKQSIYRFRNADVSSYLQIRKMFEDGAGKVVNLVNNFRSRNVIKRYFNDVFEKLMENDEKDQSAYHDIENTDSKQKEEFEGIYFYETYNGKLLEEDPSMNDFDQLSRIIKTLVGNRKYQLSETDKSKDSYGQLRNITYRDFMIIFAGKKPIGEAISCFRKNDIPVKVEGKVLFEECEALKVIISIYKAIYDKEDITSLVETLYSPLFGFKESDLIRYRLNNKKLSLNKEIIETQDKIDEALITLRKLSDLTYKVTASVLFEKIINDLKLFCFVSAQHLEIVYYTLELLKSMEVSGKIITHEDALNYLDELVSSESGLERCLSLKEDEDAVHIANLHKVKGLEAPIVILAKAGSAKNDPGIRIEYPGDKQDSTMGYVISISETYDNGISYPIISTKQFSDKEEAEKESLKKENDRHVYVAATRARNVLIINRSRQANSKSGKLQDSPSKWKELKNELLGKDEEENRKHMILELTGENKDYQEMVHDEADPVTLYNNTDTLEIKIENSYEKISPSTLKTPSRTDENDERPEGIEEEKGDTYSTLIGTMVHRMMEMIIMSDDKLSKDHIIKNIIDEYLNDEFKEYETSFIDKLNSVYKVMHSGGFKQINGAADDILPEILSSNKAYAEVPFTYRDNDQIINGIIDLIYVKDDKAHIIDWKTNRDPHGLSGHYEKQLEAYKQAVKKIIDKDVEDALIYHIAL